jgi:hypothetical protein
MLAVAVGHRNAADGSALPFMARSTSEFIGRMLENYLVEVAVGTKWLGGVLEAFFISPNVTALASIDASDGFVKGVAIEIIDRGLINLGDFRVAEEDVSVKFHGDQEGVRLFDQVVAIFVELL